MIEGAPSTHDAAIVNFSVEEDGELVIRCYLS